MASTTIKVSYENITGAEVVIGGDSQGTRNTLFHGYIDEVTKNNAYINIWIF